MQKRKVFNFLNCKPTKILWYSLIGWFWIPYLWQKHSSTDYLIDWITGLSQKNVQLWWLYDFKIYAYQSCCGSLATQRSMGLHSNTYTFIHTYMSPKVWALNKYCIPNFEVHFAQYEKYTYTRARTHTHWMEEKLCKKVILTEEITCAVFHMFFTNIWWLCLTCGGVH